MSRSVLILCVALAVSFIESGGRCYAYQGRPLAAEEVVCLVDAMQESGLEHDYVMGVLSDSRIRFMPGIVRPLSGTRESMRMYRRFLQPAAIAKARRFAQCWRGQLDELSWAFGVDAEVVIAILLVETSLGDYLGQYSIISVFCSIILEHSMAARGPYDHDSSQQAHLARLADKADWARKELRTLLLMKREFAIDIFSLRGSRAGAFGLPQFLPSSYVGWGHDGDRNEEIDLFCIHDAIASTMKYLQAHGWQFGRDDQLNRRILWQYNHSHAYVETVMRIASQLRPYVAHGQYRARR